MDRGTEHKANQRVISRWLRRRSRVQTNSPAGVVAAGPYFAGWKPFAVLLVLAIVGTFATGFLDYRHVALTSHLGTAGDSVLCRSQGSINCDAILLTDYAVLFGYFSSALLGLVGFVFVLWLAVNALLNQRIRKLSWICLVIYFAAAIGFSWYYAYIMIFEVDFVCPWCIVVHVVNLLSLVFVIVVSIRKRQEFLLPEISTIGERLYFVGVGLLISLSVFFMSGMVEKSLSFDDAKAKYEELANDPVVINAMLKASPDYQIPLSAQDPIYGSPAAPYPIVLFSDFQCPICAEAEKFLRRVVDMNPNVVKLVYKNYPLSLECNYILLGNLHPMACAAARAASAAFLMGGPKSFWAYADLLFSHQRELKTNPWVSFAQQIGLEPQKFQELMNSGSAADKKVAEDVALGIKLRLTATPQVFFEGKKIPENLKGEIFIDTLEQLVRAHDPNRTDFKLKRH
ncbi:MAG: vitamin K epoxide reductase family protein [Desulfomonilaceae bacterium]